MSNKFPISKATYDILGRRITPRMYKVAEKKRLVLAVAAVIYNRTGSYAKTYRLLMPCLSENMQIRLTEHWVRVKLKRLGLGMSKRHSGEAYSFNEWQVTRLSQETYKSYGDGPGEIVIISHHHKNGAAFETKYGACWHCKTLIPGTLSTFDKLITLKRKIT